MRTYVCGQCHVEYYFARRTRRCLPLGQRDAAGEIYDYYATVPNGFAMDWQHPDSQAGMLKAQHPEFEIWSSGVHAESGVSCADCHMPYMRDNGQKYTSHWVTSPMKHIKELLPHLPQPGRAMAAERVKTTQTTSGICSAQQGRRWPKPMKPLRMPQR